MRSQMIKIGVILMVTLASHQGIGCVVAQSISYNGSMHYTTGSYFFTENTESVSFLNGFMVSGSKINASLSVPFIYQNSPWISYGATGYLPTGGSQHGSLADSSGNRPGRGQGGGGMGKFSSPASLANNSSDSTINLTDTLSYNSYSFGDPSVYANYNLIRSNNGATSLQLNANLKIPMTSTDNGFGTGEWDFGFGASLSQRFLSNNFLYVDLMKWWYGDMPDLKLQDPFSYSIGYSRSLANGKWLVSTSLSGFTEIINDYEPPLSVSTGLGYIISSKISMNSSLSFGLTESSSDVALGVGWSIRL